MVIQIIINSPFSTKPKFRSNIRMFLGKSFFTLKRYWVWFLQRKKFAKTLDHNQAFSFPVSAHQTPLIRDLGPDSMPLQYNKIINLKLTLPKINGIILNPGETFSFWRMVGKPTKSKGYVEGMILHNGKCAPGIGGGLCQLSNLIYWMTLHTPLTITERWRHNYDVFPDADRTQPFGSGATVVYNYVDLQITNSTDHPYQLKLWLDESFLYGSWYSTHERSVHYEIYESEHVIRSHWWGGYTRRNVLKRKVTDGNGDLVDDQLVCENEAIMMYEPLLASS